MIYLPNGTIQFNDIGELYYELFMEMGLYVKTADSYLYDQDTSTPIMFDSKYIKANTNNAPIYAGANDIAFEPGKNYKLISQLFGYYLTKAQYSEDGDLLQGFIAWYDESMTDEKSKFEKKKVTIKTEGRGTIESQYYFQIYLAFIDCIFRINNKIVDLSNFDCPPEIVVKRVK
jgi:hypothetical protein